ncbi:helix-turn-helix transcriptional regulator [Comamonas jiangduensis]|jgi:transcriptional regulator with XRE-family HTH domain|uniref:helix-turn-helix transcriptional regulator n=1 Tax=Comamonas jiangduensis TaxID=1194168 RepID=UPI0028A66994|nr:helix-turn-helix transcriptional regulator [Comamonas jiangduensis]
MKYDESTRTSKNRLKEAAMLGKKLHALRIAMGITQADAAARAGLSRSTAVLIEAGDESRTVTQILRYLDAISPRTTLLALLTDDIGAVKNMNANAIRKRVRSSSGTHVYAKSHTSAMAAETPSVKQVASAITTNKKADPYGF